MATRTKSTDRAKELTELKETFDAKVLELRNSESWVNMLKTMSAFHRYSFQNMMLIMSQNAEATYCAGYQTWKKLGYQVRKGEKGLRILAPVTYTVKDSDGKPVLDDEGKEKKGLSFRVTSTFDISQVDATESAQPLDFSMGATKLTGAGDNAVRSALIDGMTALGWHISFEPIAGPANGYTESRGKKILVDSDNEPAQQLKTLIHECAHALLHAELEGGEYVLHRGLYETEAESTAYVVAAACGFDTSDYSVGYVAGWSDGSEELLRSTGENVLKAARAILGMIEKEN